MATFSISDAIGSGFGLIRRRPLSVLAWGLAYFVLAGLPALIMFGWIAPDYFSFLHQAMQGAFLRTNEPPDPAMFMPMQMKVMMLQPLIFVSSLLGRAVLTGAIFRAVLEPKNTSFASLRIGAQELWLGLLMLAAGILAFILVVAVLLAGGLIGVALGVGLKAAQVETGWIVLAEVVLGLITLAVFIWIVVRFSLAAPMTFAQREFRLFESWSLTKGHAWRLFGMALLLALVLILLVAVVECLAVAVVLASVGMDSFDHAHLESFFKQPPEVWASTLWPWLAGFAVLGAFVSGAFAAIAIAPWAVAYRELTGARAAAPSVAWPAPDEGHGAPAAAAAEPPADHHGDSAEGHHADESHSGEENPGDAHGDDQDHHGP